MFEYMTEQKNGEFLNAGFRFYALREELQEQGNMLQFGLSQEMEKSLEMNEV